MEIFTPEIVLLDFPFKNAVEENRFSVMTLLKRKSF
jgi:hypothetical protein